MKTNAHFISPFYLKVLNEKFEIKKKKNKAYGLRAFARDLSLHPATLSMVLNQKRPIPMKHLKNVMKKLILTPMEELYFKMSLLNDYPHRLTKKINSNQLGNYQLQNNDEVNLYLEEEKHFKIISEWEYFALLCLVESDGFISDKKYIASRLDISIKRCEVVIQNLIDAKIISLDGNKNLIATGKRLVTSSDVQSRALKLSHLQTLDLAKEKLEGIDLLLRDFSSTCFSMDPQDLPAIKKIIQDFRTNLSSQFSKNAKKEVYQLSIQFFPLTKNNIEKKDSK